MKSLLRSSGCRGAVAAVAAALVLAGTLPGCSSEEPGPELTGDTEEVGPGPEAEQAVEALREKLANAPRGPKEAELVKEYKPKYPPEIEERLVELRFLDDEAPETLAQVQQALGHEHEAIRTEALSKLEDIGGDAVYPLLGDALAKDPSAEVRMRAVEALDFLGGRAATDQLLRGLSDDDGDVREAVVDALAFLAEPKDRKVLEAALAEEGDRGIKEDLQDVLDTLDAPRPEPAAEETRAAAEPAAPATGAAAAPAAEVPASQEAAAGGAEKPTVQ